MRDSYLRFLESFKVSPNDLYEFGLKEIIAVPNDLAEIEWQSLKQRINSNELVAIRSFGRQGGNSQLMLDLYKVIFKNEKVMIDKTNNAAPTKLIRDLTGYSKVKKRGFKQLRNYQISHVFGKTKNPFAFTAPWNIVYLPKIIDPFTGHEAKGQLSDEFKPKFQKYIYGRFSQLIDDFNEVVTDRDLLSRIGDFIEAIESDELRAKLRKLVKSEFDPIIVNT